MSDHGSRFGTPNPEQPQDLQAILAAAMRAEADRVMPAGDGLAKIRARTEGRRGVFHWFSSPSARPAMAVGALVFTLVAGTLVGLQLTGGDDGGNDFADGARDPLLTQPFSSLEPLITPEPKIMVEPSLDTTDYGPSGGEEFDVDTETTAVPLDARTRIAPVTEEEEASRNDGGIPEDDGGNYVAIQGPLSGRSYNSPLTIAGVARVFEAQVTIDISQNGKVLQRAYATATAGAPELGDWQATIELAPGNYRIDAYALSPEDGTTKLASDSIWITIKAPNSATQPTPTPSPTSTSTPRPSSTPTGVPSSAPSSDVGTQQVPGTEP
ncbi:Gmad2 immunoglobulin-like domain-containing protein [Sporichthya sp.]|uniref:Gmad2 immunoglobulin-like domain-containing protein n=1 Tax=Sporichthya sp. TaxID=65475 RepID=UPI0017C267DF|nr:Gmad2 immunoglobulin-like domain-containing protein [Sporichthya sp.]MBA3745627.1 Gmad2 immunoglobulin-like domain-containing protein [Sporichthya sp.]